MDVSEALNRPGFRDRVAELWGMDILSLCPRVNIEGSPERSLSRAVFDTPSGERFLLEQFSREKYPHRKRVADTQHLLNQRGLGAALAPEMARTGESLAFIDNQCYQITRYLDSTGVERPGWLSSREMGGAMAGFLVDMQRAAADIPDNIGWSTFSIKAYIYKLFGEMASRRPDIHSQYLPVLEFLEQGFMAVHDTLPTRFCHGDFHPLNIIWEGQRIKAVIDWEFTGIKPECYDGANLVGCAGIEHPHGLAMPMVTGFLEDFFHRGHLSPISLQWFPEYVLALRFAWLSEWLRTEDQQMLETELAFMKVLISHMDELRDIWGLINK